MKVLENLISRLSARRKSSHEAYLEFLRRADNPMAGDEDKLNTVMLDLVISVQQADADMKAIQEVKSLEPVTEALEELKEPTNKAYHAIRAHDVETNRIIAERAAEREGLDRAHIKLQSRASVCNDAIARIQQIKLANRHRNLFPN